MTKVNKALIHIAIRRRNDSRADPAGDSEPRRATPQANSPAPMASATHEAPTPVSSACETPAHTGRVSQDINKRLAAQAIGAPSTAIQM